MNKQEFLDRLRLALSGRIPAAQIEGTIGYYLDYINTEVRKGRSEEEVLQTLGDPRLIARTIIQTSGTGSAGVGGEYDYEPEGRGYQNGYNEYQGGVRFRRIPRWLIIIITIVVVLVVLWVVFSVLSFLAPLILVMAAVIFMVKLFRDWLN